jgi:peroxiredoxin
MSSLIATRREFRTWQKEHDVQAPKVGDPAPDFELRDADGENTVRLSDFQNQKPAALIFGSFT